MLDHLVEAEIGDLPDLAEGAGELGLAVAFEPFLEGAQDRRPAAVPDRQDEGKPEPVPVGPVQPMEALELRRRALIEARRGLLVARVPGQRRDTGVIGEVRMGADERQLRVKTGHAHGLHHRPVKRRHGGEGLRRVAALRDPGRALEHLAEGGDKALAVHAANLVERSPGRWGRHRLPLPLPCPLGLVGYG